MKTILLISILLFGCATEKEILTKQAIEELCAEEGFPGDPVCLNETRMIWDSVDL